MNKSYIKGWNDCRKELLNFSREEFKQIISEIDLPISQDKPDYFTGLKVATKNWRVKLKSMYKR